MKPALLALFCASTTLLPLVKASQLSQYELSNDKVALVLDAQGHLAEITNRQTGNHYVDGGTHAPWRMYYRSGTPLTGALDLAIDPDMQKAQVRVEKGSMLISYASLTAHAVRDGQTRELQVGLTLRVTLQDDRLAWVATIQNRETDKSIEITEIWIPWISGIGDLGLGQRADVLYWPERAGRRIANPYAKLSKAAAGPVVAPSRGGDASSLRLTYPFPASMQWFTFNNGMEGLYVGSHDKTLMTTCLNVAVERDKAFSASIVKYPFVKAGESWTSEPVVIRLYRGGWHEAAHTYSSWTDSWMQKPNPPEWVRRTTGWMITNMKGQSGHIRGVYADLPTIWKQAHSVGINTVNFFGWAKQGFDNLYPEYDPDEAMGGAEGLKAAVAQVKAGGGRTILYTQGQLIDPSSEFYRTTGKSMVARDIWGYEYRETYGGGGEGTLLNVMRNKLFGIACPSAAGWYEHLASQYELVRGFGAQGMLFDQMGGIPPYICFSTEHPHSKPSLAVGPGKVRNMQRLRELMKSHDPDFAFIVELATDCYLSWVDMVHSHGIGFWPEPEAFGEMLRYTFPEAVITNRGGGPDDRRTQLGYAFSIGWRIDSNQRDAADPVLARYLARLNALRTAHPELLLEGRFVDTENFLCDNNQIASHAFVSGNRMAVTLWNPTDVAQQVKVMAPGYTLESAEWEDPSWSGLQHTVMPGDLAVQIFQRR